MSPSSLPLSSLPLSIAAIALFGIFALRTLLIAGSVTAWTRWSPTALARRIYRRAIPSTQMRDELKATVGVLTIDVAVGTAANRAGLIHFSAPTLASVVATFALNFVWFEIWFYVTHRLLHTRWGFRIHRQHHVAHVVDPLASLSFGAVERLVLITGAMGFAALVSRRLPIAAPGLALYFFSNYLLNVLGHSNVELFPREFPASRAGQLFISSSYHAMHHARTRGHYGLFTSVLDRLFGTAFADYPEVHRRAVDGRGLTRLGERLAEGRS